jgi:hypothetical protein
MKAITELGLELETIKVRNPARRNSDTTLVFLLLAWNLMVNNV